MSTTIVYPNYYRVIRCENGRWFIKTAKLCGLNSSIGLPGEEYGVSSDELLIALFQINGGKAGYYLANLRDRKYYFCGISLEDVRHKLLSLGISRIDPHP
ncbi:hypothetical protein [Scytonema sp. NUACC26]|uniref:hypothetical protein n=1 Tax=Scytonema sp. NUACC26 TaxID=3140176 RepID=UPI0034DC9BC3